MFFTASSIKSEASESKFKTEDEAKHTIGGLVDIQPEVEFSIEMDAKSIIEACK